MGLYIDGGPQGGGGGGATSWTALNDTPSTITPNHLVSGDGTGTALTFLDPSSLIEGIKYAWADATERLTQTGMVQGELGVQRDTGDVYRYDGSSWTLFFSLTDGSPDLMITGTGNPNGVITGVFGQQYRDTATGTLYIQVANPSGSVWIVD